MDFKEMQFRFHDARRGGGDDAHKGGAADLALQVARAARDYDPPPSSGLTFSESLSPAGSLDPTSLGRDAALQRLLTAFQPIDDLV